MKSANAICVDAAFKLSAINQSPLFVDSSSPTIDQLPAIASFYAAQAVIQKRTVEKLRQLSYPSQSAAAVASFLDLETKDVQANDAAIAAAKAKDLPAFVRADDLGVTYAGPIAKAAHAIGLDAC